MTQKTLAKLLCGFFFILSSVMYAQTVKGTVSDADGPLPGATVLVKGTTNGEQTDFDGNYELKNVKVNDVIVFSYIGYKSKEVTYTGQARIDVTLQEDAAQLDEIVLVGYGTSTVRDATGAVSTLKPADFNRGVITTPNELIQGNVTGVQVTQASGEPGGASSIRIRGIGSPRAGNEPLVVIDGVPLNNAVQGAAGADLGFGGTTPPRNPLSFINPNDIESITVLKDASATAIYGSRASNGVILITTKRGRSGKPQLSFNTSFAIGTLRNAPDVLTGPEHAALTTALGATPAGNADINGIDEVTRTAVSQTYDVSFTSGNDNSNYRLSLGIQDLEGIVEDTGQERYSANFNGRLKFFDDKLSISTNIQVSGINDQFAAISNDAGFEGSLIGAALQWNPTRPLYNPDGSFNQFSDTEPNPRAFLDFFNDDASTTRIVANLSTEYKLTENLTYKFLFGIDRFLSTRRSSLSPDFNRQGNFGIGQANVANVDAFSKTFTHTLTYNKDLSERVKFNGLLGYEAVINRRSGSNINASGFTSDPGNLSDFLGAASQTPVVSSFDDPTDDLQSFFTRAEIGLDNKYLLTLNFRVDGSSKFGENNNYGYFPSAAFAWVASDEEFFSDAFDLFKVRLGYGQVGNSNFPAGASLEQFNFLNGAASQFNAANQDLTWEVVTNYNIGVDFGIFDSRLTGTIEYFYRETEDLLFQLPAAAPAPGGVFSWQNLPGQVVNSGVELALNWKVVEKDDWSFDITTNLSYLKNEVQNTGFGPNAVLVGATSGQGGGVPVQRIADGQPLFAFYLPIFTGYDANGLPTYQDIDGDGVGTSDLSDRTFVGDPNPDVLLGLRLGGRYKRWDFAANLNGAFGHDIFNNTNSALLGVRSAFPSRNVSADLDVLNIDAGAANAASTLFLESGDFLRLTSLNIGYDVKLGESAWMDTLRLSVTGQNLFVLTSYSGFDPEVNTVRFSPEGVPSFGIEYTPFPPVTTISFGINASF
jgi:iron complex outermembrane receptor protein